MSDRELAREKELCRIREEIIRTTREIGRLTRQGAGPVQGRTSPDEGKPRRTGGVRN